jgi:hypothetical protein
LRTRQWFITGEADNLRQWQSLFIQAQSGSISDAALAQAFESKILPFWKSATERTVPDPSLPPDEQVIARELNAYAKERRDWASAIVSAVRSNSTASASSMQFYLERTTRLSADLERRSADENAELVSHAILRSELVTRVRSIFLPAPACVRSPTPGRSTGPHDLDSDGPKRRESLGCAAQAAFRSGKFQALEDLFAKYPPEYLDPADGGSDRYSIQIGIDDLVDYGGVPPEEILVSLASWRHQYPHSILPRIIEASAFTDWGWAARGHGYATSITPQQMQVFEYRNDMAEGVLEDIKESSEEEPLWYVLAINVKLDLGETKGEIRSVFDDGIRKFPGFLPLYRTDMRTLMPRWGGSYEKVNDVINVAASNVDPAMGAQMYARLYWAYAVLEGDDVDIFADSMADWPRISAGFDLLLKHYPDSDYLLNGFAYMACRAQDSNQYHSLKARLNNRLSTTAWSEHYSPKECDKKYAGNGA